MSAPNLNNNTTPISIVAGMASAVATASYADLVANAAGSNQSLKIESLRFANKGTTNVNVYAQVVRTVTNAGTYTICFSTPVPPSNVLEVITREGCIYLLEGDKIQIQADFTSRADAICSYELLG